MIIGNNRVLVFCQLLCRFSERDRTECRFWRVFRRHPWWRLGFHIGSNSLVPKRQSIHSYYVCSNSPEWSDTYLHHQLMGSCNHFQSIRMVKLFSYICAKVVPCATLTHLPTSDFIRVWPQQVAHCSFMRSFLKSFERPYIVQSLYARRESAMHTQELSLNQSR